MKLQHVPLSASPTIPEIENTVHHICFTSLELQKREGGEQKSEFTKSTLREQLNWVSFFFFFFCHGVQLNLLPSLFSTSPRALSGEVRGGR